MKRKAKPEEMAEELKVEAPEVNNEAFLRESTAGTVIEIGVAYREFVQYLDGNFPPWSELPDETKQLYAQSVDYVRTGNAPRSEFERVVRRLLDESPLADRVAA